MQNLGAIEGCDILLRPDGAIEYIAKAAIDCDGSDNRHHDPCWQADTSLHHHGQPIDAESVPYVVVPPLVIKSVRGIVLGCAARATHILTGKTTKAVVADVGPRRKLGEMSCECARRLGLDGNPNHGGTDRHVIRYEIFPGTPAVVDGVTYSLKASA